MSKPRWTKEMAKMRKARLRNYKKTHKQTSKPKIWAFALAIALIDLTKGKL